MNARRAMPRASPTGDDGRAGAAAASLARLERLARLLDSAFRIPGIGLRVGLDPLIGLIPGVGDAVSFVLSAYLIAEARRHGAPRWLLARMAGNVALDTLVGAIPLAGDAFDVVWRANQRNMKLLRRHLEKRSAAT